MASASKAALAEDARPDTAEDPSEFPGCRPVRVTSADLDDYQDRFEYWDRDTQTAFVVREPTSVYHEGPGQRLTNLLPLIAAVRGAPILTLGTSDLALRDERGQRRRIMQADQIVYLEPAATQPRGPWVEVGSDHLPDVVLEVDYSTDVRRGQAGAVRGVGLPRGVGRGAGVRLRPAAAGPDDSPPVGGRLPGGGGERRPAGLDGGGDSRGAERTVLSESTRAVLERVGRALGEAGGTGPDDDLWLGAQRREARGEGHAAGRTEGRAEIVGSILRSRGLAVSERLAARIAGEDPDMLVAAALACCDEADLLARLQPRSRPAGPRRNGDR